MNAFERTIANQRRAATPDLSAFVMANAGSGKTRVLIDRVARLLLTGASPEKILCITFTKAAAAEMVDRLFERLGKWSLADDETLRKDLIALEGVDANRNLGHARRLFARALETPGGLKVQTIHSFCEGVLRRFPLEAGIAPGFTVVDETDARQLASDALDRTARLAANNAELAQAFARLARHKPANDLRDLFINAALARQTLQRALDQCGGFGAIIQSLEKKLDVNNTDDAEALKRNFIEALDLEKLRAAMHALDESGGNPKKLCAAPLQSFFGVEGDFTAQWDHLHKLFLKSNGEARGKYGTKKTEAAAPWLEDQMLQLEVSYIQTLDRIRAIEVFEDTRAYLTILEETNSSYSKAKTARALLDYDDLIDHAYRALLNRRA